MISHTTHNVYEYVMFVYEMGSLENIQSNG